MFTDYFKAEDYIKYFKNTKTNKRQTHSSSQNDQFELQYHQIKKLGLQLNKKKLKVGSWSLQENLVYLGFLEENRSDFISEYDRRKNKVFYKLSKVLKKRTPDQCRSHHQKLQMKFNDNIDKIIENLRSKLKKISSEFVLKDIQKLDQVSKKTEVTDAIEQPNGIETQQLQSQSFYKFSKIKQNQLSLQIFIDQIKQWN